MKCLTNLTTLNYNMEWFDNDWGKIIEFLKRNALDAVELMLLRGYDMKSIPKNSVAGMHLSYWTLWLDFWRENHDALLKQFGSTENITSFYGGLDKNVLVEQYKWELEAAKTLGVDYAVFHVSHCEVLHTITREFTYSDCDVLEAAAELINESFGDKDEGVTLLFENLWMPGLKLTEPELVGRFLDRIDYPNKGIMLDTGHLMATNPEIKTDEEACGYILSVVNNLGELKKHIKGIHLSKSLSGDFQRSDHSEAIRQYNNMTGFWEKLDFAGKHVQKIDWHIPFDSPAIQEVIEEIKPEYLVFEVLPKSLEELEEMLKVQRSALNKLTDYSI